MSEYITHISVHDDCRNLALFADTLPEIKQSLQNHLRAGRLGAVTSQGDRYTIDLLKESKQGWPSKDSERMLAFFFGWRSHIAADRQLKSLFRLLEPEIYTTTDIDGPTSVSIYQDLYVLKELYEGGRLAPFSSEMLSANHASRQIEEIFTGLWQNSLLGLHPLTTATISSRQESDRWFEQFLGLYQKFYVDPERYVSAYNNLDADKMREVVKTHRFYDRTNPLIQLTESLRRGEPDDSIDLAAAVEAAKSQSHYARALRRGWRYLQATAAFWQDQIDIEALQTAFEVDEPHTDKRVFDNLENDQRREALLREWHETGGQ